MRHLAGGQSCNRSVIPWPKWVLTVVVSVHAEGIGAAQRAHAELSNPLAEASVGDHPLMLRVVRGRLMADTGLAIVAFGLALLGLLARGITVVSFLVVLFFITVFFNFYVVFVIFIVFVVFVVLILTCGKWGRADADPGVGFLGVLENELKRCIEVGGSAGGDSQSAMCLDVSSGRQVTAWVETVRDSAARLVVSQT